MVFAEVMNWADIRLIERGRGLGFAAKPAQRLRIFGEFLVGDKYVSSRLSTVNSSRAASIGMIENMAERVGFESALKRNFNSLAGPG